jgi:hypothetical protein
MLAKRVIIRWEMEWYLLTGIGYLGSISTLVVGAPDISNLTIACIQLFTGLTATLAAAASAIKTDDTVK